MRWPDGRLHSDKVFADDDLVSDVTPLADREWTANALEGSGVG
ncbi:MAG TPA: hypothetical protein PLO41_06295 [Rubrivivax sp.]|nr:hypothetical protein [Rubrivivax sp.]